MIDHGDGEDDGKITIVHDWSLRIIDKPAINNLWPWGLTMGLTMAGHEDLMVVDGGVMLVSGKEVVLRWFYGGS